MKKCIEDNPWHKNISVYDHTIDVLKELNKILEKNINSDLDLYLSKKENNYFKKDLLFL
jgi:hypothetical protein